MRGRCEDKVIEDRELEFTLGEGTKDCFYYPSLLIVYILSVIDTITFLKQVGSY